ncbi:MAG: VIT1/CCC1 transporter family protein [Dehalococcoidia bacterium]|nr:VIT1/CCC1 transporter family protein [Dehalococcoidia bacterium]
MRNPDSTISKTDRNLWNAIVSEAMAHLKYSAYAHKALEEGYPEVAQVFQEVAGAETIHGMNHLRVSGEVRSSIENLRNVVTGESKEISTMYPRMVKDALDDGRMDAADTFTLAMDRERHHLEVFSKALEELEARQGRETEAAAPADQGAGTVRRPDPLQVVEPETSPTYARARQEVEGERWRVAAAGRIREVVFGAQDGLVSTVALVTGVAVAGADNPIVLVAGLAGALAGVISMGTGAYLGSRAEQDVQRAEIEKEAAELAEHPAEELAELVVLYQREGLSFEEAKGVAEHIAADKDLWLTTMVEKELGLSYEGTVNPIKDALAMGAAFIAGAIVPVLPYFFTGGSLAITASVAATLTGLFVLGIGKGRIVRQSPVLQGLEVLSIGAVSAGAGFGLGLIV